MCVDMIKITQILITERNMVYKCPQLHEKLCLCIYIYAYTHIYVCAGRFPKIYTRTQGTIDIGYLWTMEQSIWDGKETHVSLYIFCAV